MFCYYYCKCIPSIINCFSVQKEKIWSLPKPQEDKDSYRYCKMGLILGKEMEQSIDVVR